MNQFTFYANKPSQKYNKVDIWLLASILLLWGLGIFTLYVCSQNFALRAFGDPIYFVKRQLLCSAVGFVLFAGFAVTDMKELGAESVKSHEAIGRRIGEVCPELVYLVGPEMKAAEKLAEGKDNISVKWFEESNDKNFEAIAADINLQADENDVILLKGSHSMQLEKLVPLLCGSEGEAC